MFHISIGPQIDNCTFSRNSANNGYAGAIYSYQSSPAVVNSILWDNSDSSNDWDVVVEKNSFAIMYSDYSSIATVVGSGAEVTSDNCIHVDPEFADPVNGDFHLKSKDGRWNGSSWVTDSVYSKCLAHGYPGYAHSKEPESGGKINMGAYGNTGEASKLQISNLCVLRVSAIKVPEYNAGPDGARWKLSYEQEGTWHKPSNFTAGFAYEDLVAASDYYVYFKDVSNYDTPAPIGPKDLEPGFPKTLGGFYYPK